jgi:hypothetical protein
MSRWKVRRVAVLGAALPVLLALAPAAARAIPGSGPRETADSVFTTTLPGAPSGSIYEVTYRNPSDPSRNPPAVRTVLVVSPPGTRIDTSVPARCTASDQELQLEGDAACPPKSRIGSGTVTTSVLGGPPSTSPISVFNTADGVIQLVKFASFGVAVVRSKINGATVRTQIPTCLTGGQPPKGCPFDQAVVLASRLDFKKFHAHGRSYLTTPPSCPISRRWRTRLTYTYGDGAVESVVSSSRCRRAPRGGGPCPRRCGRPDDDREEPAEREDDDVDLR